MKWNKERVISRLALPITRECNRECPECPARERNGIYGKGPREPHVSIDELKWVGKMIGPIDKIEITGGEPSIHPDFREISENLHKWFTCKDIMLLTNGYLFTYGDYLPILLKYDRVYVTHYTPAFSERYGTPENTEAHDRVKDYLEDYPGIKFWSQTMNIHHPFVPSVEGANGCFYSYDKSDMVSYHRGQLYGCCTAWELDYQGKGILLTEDWRDHLNEIELPCERCLLGVAR